MAVVNSLTISRLVITSIIYIIFRYGLNSRILILTNESFQTADNFGLGWDYLDSFGFIFLLVILARIFPFDGILILSRYFACSKCTLWSTTAEFSMLKLSYYNYDMNVSLHSSDVYLTVCIRLVKCQLSWSLNIFLYFYLFLFLTWLYRITFWLCKY